MCVSNLTSGRVCQHIPAATLRRPACLFALAFASLPLLSCHKDVTASGPQVAAIEIAPTALTLSPGAVRPLNATVLDEAGSKVSVQVFWAAQDSRIAAVSSQGMVTGLAPGRTQIAASKGGVSAMIPVTVSPLPAALVRVAPTSSTIDVGKADTLIAEVLDSGGGVMNGPVINWSSASSAIATVSSRGIVTGVSAGTAVITAATGGLSGTAVVIVRPTPVSSVSVAPVSGNVQVGKTLQLNATVRDAAGNVLSGRTVTWSSDNLTRATVLPGGLVTGLTKGSVTIRATVDGKAGLSSITVR
jgi:trimeric autotransporter adhesin